MLLHTRLGILGLLVAGLLVGGIVAPQVYGEGSVMDDTLVLHYTFDKDTGETAKDLSAYGNDGKIVKAEYLEEFDGRRGVLRFDGKSSYINCGDSESLHFGGDMSFEMWVRLNGPFGPLWNFIFADDTVSNLYSGSGGSFYFGVMQHTTVMFWCTNGRDKMLFPVDNRILSDKWSHIAVVVEYPRCRFYHNGKLVRDAYMPVPGITKLLNRPKHIGGVEGAFCPIDLDEFRLYRRALTAAEVAAHAKGEEVPPGRADELAVEAHSYEEAVALRLSCKGTDYSGHTAEMTLLQGDSTEAVVPQRAALTEAFEGSGRYVATVKFPLLGLENKSLDGVARILAPDGQLVRTVYRHAFLGKPEWVDTKEGYSDEVMPPWTPVEAEAKPDGTVEVRVWGRRHVFGPTPFLRQIETRGTEILTSPITLKGRVNGRAIAWRDGRIRLKETSKTAASLEQICESDRVILRVDTNVEYDGYMIFDCEIQARRDLSLEELTLEIPLRTRHATLCYGTNVYPPDPQVYMNRWHSGAVPGDLAFRFGPNVWLGDEERGLCWQVESDEDWHYADKQKAIEILPRGETTTFKAHLVDVPTRLAAGEALHYKFALLATPVKPLLRDSWDLRIVRSEPYGADLDIPDRKTNGKPTLQYLAEAGVRHMFINVTDMWPYPMPVHEKFSRALHRLINETHAHGLKLYPYLIHHRFPVMVPEFDIHGLHMSNRPLKDYPIGGPASPEQKRPGPITTKYGANSQGCVDMCSKSKALQDAYIHSLARRFDEYGDDGIYLDEPLGLYPCENTAHGCGYRTEDGSIRPTYPVFAVREFLKRIYTVVKQRRPDGVVDVHCSFNYNPAGLAYADMYWHGEQWTHLRHTGAKDGYIAAELPLDMFRTEFMGHQIGVGAETLSYRLGATMKDADMKVAATSLLHDVPVRPSTGTDYCEAIIYKLWRVRDQFGAKEAEKLFYWNNQDYVRVSPEKCRALLFKHPRNGVLAFVSNLRRDEQTVTVQFNLDKLNLRDRKLHVFNTLTDEPMAMTSGGKLSVPLGSEEWIYIWLRPTGGK